jgi:glycogen debranching enzyme
VLFAAVASDERARRVAADLMSPRFLTGWGVRTVADGEARYNPMSYHNGSVWPHDNAMIALGLARYGHFSEALTLTSALFDAAAHMHLRRLPELFCGFERKRGKAPTLYPVACAPQAWAAVAPYALIQACLGLEIDCGARKVRLRRPRLPHFIDWMTVKRLSIGEARVDLMLRRHDSSVAVNLLARQGSAEVEVML